MNNFQKQISSGNSFVDLLLGGGVGLGETLNRPGRYYVRANYQGDGLANTGMEYLANTNRRDFTSAGNAIAALLGGNKNKKQNFVLSKLSSLRNRNQGGAPYTLQGELKNPPYEGYGNYNLPYQNYQLPQTSFNYNGVVPKQYGLPTQSYGTLDFNRWK